MKFYSCCQICVHVFVFCVLRVTDFGMDLVHVAFEHNMRIIVCWNLQGSLGHEFNIYLHARPGYSYTKQNTKCRFFVNRQLNNSIQVQFIADYLRTIMVWYATITSYSSYQNRVCRLSQAAIITDFQRFLRSRINCLLNSNVC